MPSATPSPADGGRPVTGTETEATALLGWLTDPEAPRLCLVTGAPGSGKTALLGWFAKHGPRAGRPRRRTARVLVPLAGQSALGATWTIADRLGVVARSPGDLVHALATSEARPAGRAVLLLTDLHAAAEPAALTDLIAELAGVGRVRLAVRTVPHIVRRTTAGWPAQRTGILVRRLPTGLVDRMGALMARAGTPDLSAYGLPRPDTGLATRMREGAVPVQDVGLIDAVRAGKVGIVAAVEAFEGGEVVLADGTRIAPDAVIAATGYRRALEPLVGHLNVLDDRGRPVAHGPRSPREAPGLYFTGFTNPISGMFRELAIDAEKIARRIARTTGRGQKREMPL